jgi:hypothetical protein
MYSSTSFGRPRAHHQELNKCSSGLWYYRWSVVVTVLLVVVGPSGLLEIVASIWLIILNCMMMYGLANFKLKQ